MSNLDAALHYSANPDTPVSGIMEPQLAQYMIALRRLVARYEETCRDCDLCREAERLLTWEPTRPLPVSAKVYVSPYERRALERLGAEAHPLVDCAAWIAHAFRCPRCETEYRTMSGAEACSLLCAGQGTPRRD